MPEPQFVISAPAPGGNLISALGSGSATLQNCLTIQPTVGYRGRSRGLQCPLQPISGRERPLPSADRAGGRAQYTGQQLTAFTLRCMVRKIVTVYFYDEASNIIF
jgi:hypothetical protein